MKWSRDKNCELHGFFYLIYCLALTQMSCVWQEILDKLYYVKIVHLNYTIIIHPFMNLWHLFWRKNSFSYPMNTCWFLFFKKIPERVNESKQTPRQGTIAFCALTFRREENKPTMALELFSEKVSCKYKHNSLKATLSCLLPPSPPSTSPHQTHTPNTHIPCHPCLSSSKLSFFCVRNTRDPYARGHFSSVSTDRGGEAFLQLEWEDGFLG